MNPLNIQSLISRYKDMLQPAQQTLSNIGKQVASLPQQFQAMGQMAQQRQQRPQVSAMPNMPQFKPSTPQYQSRYYQMLQPLASVQQRVIEPIRNNLSPTNYNTPVVGKIRQFNQGLNNFMQDGDSGTERMFKSFDQMSRGTVDSNYIGDALAIGPGSIRNVSKKLLEPKVAGLIQKTSQATGGVRIDRTQLSGLQLSKSNEEIAAYQNKAANFNNQQTNSGQQIQLQRTKTPKQEQKELHKSLSYPPYSKAPEEFAGTNQGTNILNQTPKNGSIHTDPLVNYITDKPGLNLEDKNAFADWTNYRRAVDTEKKIAADKFRDLDEGGLNTFFDIQAGKVSKRFNEVRTFLDDKFKMAKKTGMDFNYQKDYLPQLWDNSPEEISQVLGKRLSTNAGFTIEKIIDDYKTGIKAGLTPKFQKTSDLLAWYEGAVNKVVADRTFLNHLKKNNLILPLNEAPNDWITINPDRFPKSKQTFNQDAGASFGAVDGMDTFNAPKQFEINESYKAPKELAEMINNYLYKPGVDGNQAFRGLNSIANYVSRVKNITLSFGIPGTAINSHGVNILARHTMFGQGGNMITRFLKGANYMVNQYSSGKNINRIIPELPAAIKKGLTVSVEDRKSILEGSGIRGKFGEAWSRVFEVALFDKMIPSLKYDSYQALVKDFSKKMSPDQAGREAAKMVNNIYGGINIDQVGRSRDMQNVLRIMILAPDWAETTLKLGGNFAKSLKSNSPVARKYQNMMAGFITAYIGANIANKLSSGKWMYENDSGHTFEIESGYTSDGQKRYLRPFGTGADMFRLPLDTVMSLAKGDLSSPGRIVRNRLSIPAGVGFGYFTDTDYRNQAIGWRSKDKYGNEIPTSTRAVNIAGEVASLVGVPSFIREGIKTASGQQGLEQGIVQGSELPFRYSGGARSKSQKTVEGVAQAEGKKGKDLYELNKKTNGVTLSKNQSELIRQGGTSMLDPILEVKRIRSQKTNINNIITQMGEGTLSPEEGQIQIEKVLQESPSSSTTESKSGIKEAGASNYPPESIVGTPENLKAYAKTGMSAQDKMLEDSKISMVKYKLEFGQSLTRDEAMLYTKPPKLPKLSGADEIDAVLLSKYEGSLTSNVNNIVELTQKGQLDEQTAVTMIQRLGEEKVKVNAVQKAMKARGKGRGVGRARKGRNPTLITRKMPNLRYTPKIKAAKRVTDYGRITPRKITTRRLTAVKPIKRT